MLTASSCAVAGSAACRAVQRSERGPDKAQPSDEGLIKELPPVLKFLRAGALAALQIDIGMMTGIAVRNHLELGSTGLQGHQLSLIHISEPTRR